MQNSSNAMRQASTTKGVVVHVGMKAATFLVVAVLVFSPFNQIFQTLVVSAANECVNAGQATTDPVKDKNGNLVCPAGYFDPTHKIPTDESSDIGTVDGKKVVAGTDAFNSIASFLAYPIYLFTAGLGGFVAATGAYLFNLSIHLSLSSTAYALKFITDGWTTARDVANMFFILILIYIAITIMLSADTAGTMKMLVRVIAIALVINFSFFITRVVIDAGNFTAVQFYNQIDAKGANNKPATVLGMKDLSASIMDAVGVQKIIGSDAFNKFQNVDKGGYVAGGFAEFVVLVVLYVFLGAAYFVLAAAFVTTAIKFIVRMAMLWLLIVASPLAFVASTVPRFKGWYKDWQDSLINHAFFPVVFLFIFWLISMFAGDLKLTDSFNLYLDQVSKKGGSLFDIAVLLGNVCLKLGILVVMLYLGLQLSDKMGVKGAKLAGSITSKVPFAGGLKSYGRLGGFAFQKSVGAVAERADRGLSRTGFGTSALGTALRRYTTGGLTRTKLGGAESRADFRQRSNTDQRQRQNAARDNENRAAVGRAAGAVTAGQTPDTNDENRIRTLNAREIEALPAGQVATIAHLLSANQMQNVERSTQFNDAQREQITNAWNVRGTRTNPLQGQFGSGSNAINRADDIVSGINELQNTMRTVHLDVRENTRITRQGVSAAIRATERQMDDFQARLDVARANLEHAAGEEDEGLQDVARAQIATNLTNIRNSNNLVQHLNTLRTTLQETRPHISHHNAENMPAGEIHARPPAPALPPVAPPVGP